MVTLFLPVIEEDQKTGYGVVTQVIDGDTITVRRKNSSLMRVRLAYIDAPEKDQKDLGHKHLIGKWSSQFLRELIEGREVKWEVIKKDMYGRFIGRIFRNHQDINLEMIKNGLAIIYPFAQFSTVEDKNSYTIHFYQAYAKAKGIWSTEGMLNPYYHRKQKKNSTGRK